MKIPAIVLLVLLLLFLPFYFLHKDRENEICLPEETPIVRVMKVYPESKETELLLPSFLDAINVTPIWARTNGYLSNWWVDIGDKVKTGDLLASIDTPDVDQEVVQAEGDLGAAIAKENIARITAERGLKLIQHNPEAISREEVDQMVANHQAALADIEAAKGRLGRYKYLQGFKNLYAPFDGTITERDIDIGSLITAGSNNYAQQIFQIAKSDVLRAFVNVPQNYFHLIKDGLEAEVTIPQLPKKIFIARIDRNAGALDPMSRTLLTQVNIENPRGELLPGLYAEVKFKFKPETANFLLPIEAVIIRAGPPFVALVDSNNCIHLQQVKIGRDYGSTIEILEGLREGDLIVSRATDRIKEGIKVRQSP
ncbi:MAG: efflux RND transporter periplasmic adaptor subunit [Verrucomicrobiota bacterium]|nr:efflux RND transporter periplasmic adaptor subunit [Verrucomicrobiota bacterium]